MQSNSSSMTFMIFLLVELVILVAFIIALWKMYKKAGRPGWAAIIPIYNIYILLKIVGRPGWWILLFIIPFLNIVIMLLVSIDLAKAFGRSTAFGVVGLWLFSFIGYMILGFGKSKYLGVPKTSTPPTAPTV